jgi:hypothetical protein
MLREKWDDVAQWPRGGQKKAPGQGGFSTGSIMIRSQLSFNFGNFPCNVA